MDEDRRRRVPRARRLIGCERACRSRGRRPCARIRLATTSRTSLSCGVAISTVAPERRRRVSETGKVDPVGDHGDVLAGDAVVPNEVALDALRGTDEQGSRATEQAALDGKHRGRLRAEDPRAEMSAEASVRLDHAEVVIHLGRSNGMDRHQVGPRRGEAFDMHDVELLTARVGGPRGSARERPALERIPEPRGGANDRLDVDERDTVRARLPRARCAKGGDVDVLRQALDHVDVERGNRARPPVVPVDVRDAQTAPCRFPFTTPTSP